MFSPLQGTHTLFRPFRHAITRATPSFISFGGQRKFWNKFFTTNEETERRMRLARARVAKHESEAIETKMIVQPHVEQAKANAEQAKMNAKKSEAEANEAFSNADRANHTVDEKKRIDWRWHVARVAGFLVLGVRSCAVLFAFFSFLIATFGRHLVDSFAGRMMCVSVDREEYLVDQCISCTFDAIRSTQ